jgi:TPR repeat protein
MAIRTTIRGLKGMFRALRAAQSWGPCLAATAFLLLSSAAFADYAAGLTAFNRKDFAHAFSEWIESAKAGDAHAQHGLGMLYEMGQGVPYADPKAASEWYRKAADQNYAPAINNLARLFADGRGVKQDVPKAIELWSKAAEAGNTTARFNLGLQYAAGVGVKKDMKKAAEYLLQAAESGLPEAQFAVAGYYRDGTGVPKDMAAARQWYDRAAAAGFEPARKELAAIDKPAVSPTPVAEEAAAADTKKTETAEAAKTENPPAETHEAAPSETQQTETPPTEEAPQKQTPPAPPVEASTTGHAPESQAAGEPQPTAEEEQPAQQGQESEQAENAPEAEGSPAPDADDLPVADSLTSDARVYRIWLYESGQEDDARSYWNKLTMQYGSLLKSLDLDIRRYFLGEARGSLYRVFVGPFESLGDAQEACKDIKARHGDQFCRPVLN